MGLSNNLYKNQINFLVGLRVDDVNVITDIITDPTNDATIVLSYRDFAIFYDRINDSLMTKTKDKSVWNRLIIMSNLPTSYTPSASADLLSSS